MTALFNPDLDLTLTRIIKAPRAIVWEAWTDPRQLEQWWVPAPALCRVVALDLTAGGAFVTQISEDGGAFGPHINGCILAVSPMAQIVFTNALTAGFRPATAPFMTAFISMSDHPDGTEYSARALHKDAATQKWHEEAGFQDGWGTVAAQLADFVERNA